MSSLHDSYDEIVEALTRHYGVPPDSRACVEPFHAILAAFLGRTVGAGKVEKAIDLLRENGLADPEALADADPAELRDLFGPNRPNSLPGRLLPPLRRLAQFVVEHGGGDGLELMSVEDLRARLRALSGIGPGAADAILLYGLRRPTYPLDRATIRVLVRHGWLDLPVVEDEARSTLERLEPGDPDRLARLAFWMDRLGSDFCRASAPKCESCPLRPFLPEGGPREPDASGS